MHRISWRMRRATLAMGLLVVLIVTGDLMHQACSSYTAGDHSGPRPYAPASSRGRCRLRTDSPSRSGTHMAGCGAMHFEALSRVNALQSRTSFR